MADHEPIAEHEGEGGLGILQIGWIISGVFVIASCVLSFKMIYDHLKNYNEPNLQKHIVRIIFIVPVYAIDSWLTLVFESWALWVDLIRDCYEAYVIYLFFRLLVEFLFGEDNLRATLYTKPLAHHPIPMCCLTYSPGGTFLHRCKQALVQFIIIRPAGALAALILDYFSLYGNGDFSPQYGYLYLTIVDNISFTIALYYLVLFYEVLAEDLKYYKPLAKFLVIKSVIFFAFWQGVTISLLVSFGAIPHGSVWAEHLQAFLICIEMFGIGIAFYYSFSVTKYKGEGAPSFAPPVPRAQKRRFFSSIASVANMKDVFRDTVNSIARAPQVYVHIAGYSEGSIEDKRARIVREGWLQKRDKDVFKKWHRRYFMLLNNPEGIVYYKTNPWEAVNAESALSLQVKGFIDFHNMVHIWKTEPGESTRVKLKGNNTMISVEVSRPKKKKNRKFYLRAETTEAHEWFDAIRVVLKQMEEGLLPVALPTGTHPEQQPHEPDDEEMVELDNFDEEQPHDAAADKDDVDNDSDYSSDEEGGLGPNDGPKPIFYENGGELQEVVVDAPQMGNTRPIETSSDDEGGYDFNKPVKREDYGDLEDVPLDDAARTKK
jgi:hypothetical protein